jgi:hypothetical protein
MRTTKFVVGILVGVAFGGCAQVEETSGCDPAGCRRYCLPNAGVCTLGTCVCREADAGTEADTTDVPACVDALCADDCRTRGYLVGACLGSTCQCSGSPPDAETTDDTAVLDDAGPEDVAEEVGPADIGDPCSVDDLVVQTECGPGMKCAFTELAGSRPDPNCDRAGTRPINQACSPYSISDTCVPGGICLNDGAGSRCRRMCRNDADCAVLGSTAACAIGITMGGTEVSGISVCTMGCPYPAATGCQPEQACRILFPDSGGYSTDCGAMGTGTQGANCAGRADGDCAAGYQCFRVTRGTVESSECLRMCRLSGSDCAGLSGSPSCQALDSDPTRTYGAYL